MVGSQDSVERELLDRIAIRELVARYNRAADDGDHAGYVSCFTEDGVFEVGGARIAGRAALSEYIQQAPYGTVHLTLDPIVVIEGDSARHTCSFIVGRRTLDRRQNELVATGRYEDEVHRTPDGWRFARRVFLSDLDFEVLSRRFGGAES